MGIIDFFKKDDTVSLSDKFSNSVIHPVSNMYYTVNIGHNIVVSEGWTAAIVVKGKPRDILPAGAHQLSLINLPNTTQVLKLHKGKVKKRGSSVTVELPQSFKCDLYYVNIGQIFDFPWRTGKVPIRSKLYGRYKVGINGKLSFRVTDSAKFVSLLLIEHGHLRSGQGERVLSGLINEEVYDSILFSSFYNPRQFADKQGVNEFLRNKLNENFNHYGLSIDSVDTIDVKFYGKINEQITRESEQMPIGFAQHIDADSVLGEQPITMDDEKIKDNKLYQQPPQYQTNQQTTTQSQEQEREVTERIQVRKKYNNMQEIQDEINNVLTEGTSRIDLSKDKPTTIKLNKDNKKDK